MLTQCGRADQGHGAVLDDRIALVAVVHANPEKSVVLPIHHLAKQVPAPVTMRLWRLNHAGVRIVEVAGQ